MLTKKEYYIKNKEHILKARKEYYVKNRESILKYTKEYQIRNKEHITERTKKHREKNKEQILKTKKEYYYSNIEYIRKKMRESAAKRRKDVIDHYGGICACCGETIFEFLGVDHIDGGGIEHRKAIGMSGGSNFYAWIRKNNYPGGGFKSYVTTAIWRKVFMGFVLIIN